MAKAAQTGRSRRLRWVLGGLAVVAMLLMVAVAIAPAVASRLAPEIIESAAADSIQGSVKVARVRVGWFSPIDAGPIELRDPRGDPVATVSLDSPITLWQVVSGRWWAARSLDLGTLTLRGDVALVRYADGTTNLDAATAPRGPRPPPQPSQPSRDDLPALKARIDIASLDATIREQQADGTLGPELGVKGLAGPIDISLGNARAAATADLKAGAVVGAATTPVVIKLDASATQTTARGTSGFTPDNLERATVALDATGVPSALIDAFAGLGGALEAGLGPASDVTVRIDGNLLAADLSAQFRSPRATADAAMKIADGALVPATTGTPAFAVRFESTTFLADIPHAAPALASAREYVTVEAGPGLSLVVESLRLPVPPALTQGQPFDLAALDLRGSGAKVVLDVGAASGQVLLPVATTPAQDVDRATPAPREARPFTAEPVRVVIDATDLAHPVRITGGSRTTLDGQSAGEFAIDISAADLLDERGRLRALAPDGGAMLGVINGSLALSEFSTPLLQPFVAAAGIPLDLPIDAGPTLDLTITAGTSAPGLNGGEGIAAVPPSTATIVLRSDNLTADGALRLEGGTLTTSDEGIRVVMTSATPLARRFLAGEGDALPMIDLAGMVRVELTIAELAADLAAFDADAPLAALDGRIGATLSDARATLSLGTPGESDVPAPPAQPVDISRAAMAIHLVRGQAPRLALDANGAHAGTPFTLIGELTADGLSSGALPKAGGIDGLLALGAAGQLRATSVPPSLLAAVPQLARFAPGATVERSELDAAIADALAGAVGTGADLTISLGRPQGGGLGQVVRVQIATQAQGAGADVYARLSRAEAAITGGTSFLIADPASANALLTALGPEPGPGELPLQLGQKTKFWLQFPEPVTVPMVRSAEGALVPDFARAKPAFARLAAENDVLIANVPIGSDPGLRPEDPPIVRYASARLAKLVIEARAPLAALADDAASADPANRATVKLSADARSAEGAALGSIAIDAAAGLDASSPQATVVLAGLNTANLDSLLDRAGLLVGALGDRADATLRITPVRGAEGELAVRAELVSPTVSGATLNLAKRADRVELTEPSAITWTPAPAFLNSFRSEDEDAPSVIETSPVTITLTRFAISMAPADPDAPDAPPTGPLRPGVFDLDASFAMPRLAMGVPAPAPARGEARAAARVVSMNGIEGRALWEPAAPRAPADGDAAQGTLNASMTIASVTRDGGVGAKPSRIAVTVRGLADAHGNLATDALVLDADADVTEFPSLILDELANQGGLLAEALGPTVTASIIARNASLAAEGTSGDVEATLVSERARAELKGDIRAARFVQTGIAQVRLSEVRPQLIDELSGGLPLIASMEKSSSDEPAVIDARGLAVPLDGDLSKLDGIITVDPGVARFTTQSFIGTLLKAVGGQRSGQVGRRIDPFVVRIDKGVATYERFRLPVGEFTMETKGQVNLVTQRVNLTAYVPFFALTDEAMGPIKLGLGGRLDLIDRTTLVPISIKGPMDRPTAMIDPATFIREAGLNILQTPGRVLEGIGDLIGGKKKEQNNGGDK